MRSASKMQQVTAVVDRISTRLVALLLLPVLIATVLAGMFGYERQTEARNLRGVRDDAVLIAQVSEVRAEVSLERTLVAGFGAIDGLGLAPSPSTGAPSAAVGPEDIEANGQDMVQSLNSGRDRVDRLIADMPRCVNHSACASLDGLSEIRLAREATDAMKPRYGEAVDVYDRIILRLDDWIDEVSGHLEISTRDHPQTRVLLDQLGHLQIIADAHDTDLQLFVPLLASLGQNADPIIDQLVGNAAVVVVKEAAIEADMPDHLSDAWADYTSEAKRGEFATEKVIEKIRQSNGALSLNDVIQAGRDVSAVSDRLGAISRFQSEVGEALVEQAAADEAAARRELNEVIFVGLFGFLITALSASFIARHLSASMRQLGNAAESLQTGNFTDDDLPTSGPREIVDTARAFSTLTDTLRAVDAHATAIATGESVPEDLLLPVPGHLGESLRNSLQRVESMAERLRHEANHDELTGLFNRAGVWEELVTLLDEKDTIITTMFIDLDRFKRVNDTHGHQTGDLLLTAAGFRLQNAAGEGRMVARLGGDEFLVVAADIATEAQAVELATSLAAELDKPFTIEGRILRTSASIGVAQERANGQTVADILRVADLAAYEAKRHRSQSVVFSDDVLLGKAVESLKLEEALRGSWARGELTMHLQPVVRPGSGLPASAEALMRWTRPDGTSVSPAQFIPIAEETGMIVTIDEWMVNQACRQLAEWGQLGHPAGDLRIAVNISGQHFTDGDLVGTIQQACETHGVQARQLVVEVTESCAVEDIGHTVAVLDELHRMGLTISLDDFGTGYSSLSYLQKLPIDTVKIDKSFIDDLPTDDANAKIVELVATLSTVLELAVVAEGVETLEQADFLEALGIGYLQGYYFAKPMPTADFETWVEATLGVTHTSMEPAA